MTKSGNVCDFEHDSSDDLVGSAKLSAEQWQYVMDTFESEGESHYVLTSSSGKFDDKEVDELPHHVLATLEFFNVPEDFTN